jgi:PAS domain S-box-containing protein
MIGNRTPVTLGRSVFTASRSDVDFTAQNGFDVSFSRLSEKLDGSEDVSMVRDRHSVHTQGGGSIQESIDPNGSVEKAVFSMNMQMGKILHKILSRTPSANIQRKTCGGLTVPFCSCKVSGWYDTASGHHQQPLLWVELEVASCGIPLWNVEGGGNPSPPGPDVSMTGKERHWMWEKNKSDCDRMKKEIASLRKEMAGLRRSLNHKGMLLERFPVGFMVIQKGKIIEANEVLLSQLGYTTREVLDQEFRDFMPSRQKILVEHIYGNHRSEKADVDPHEVELIGKDGSVLSWDVKVRKIHANGRHAFLVVLTRNEERKKREENLAESLKTWALRTMASGLSKMLKNPVKVIQDTLSMALRSSGSGQTEAKSRIDDAVSRMEVVVGFLESLTRGFRDESLSAPFDLKKVVKDALFVGAVRIKEEADRRGVDVKVKTYLRSVSPVEGDPQEVRQMLSYLVRNAIEAMPEGGHLYLSTEESAGYAHIYIQDSGVGIPARIRGRILDPFFTTKGSENPGLGLNLSRAIIQRHHGEMEISSKENEGTMVTVRLPLARREGRDKKKPLNRKRIKNARILIIEEDPVIGDLLLQTLESKGSKVAVTASAAEGLLQVRKKGFDLVIVGSTVPQMRGEALARRLKESRESQRVALIVDYDIQKAARSGRATLPDLIISKPIDMSQAVERITEVLNAMS